MKYIIEVKGWDGFEDFSDTERENLEEIVRESGYKGVEVVKEDGEYLISVDEDIHPNDETTWFTVKGVDGVIRLEKEQLT